MKHVLAFVCLAFASPVLAQSDATDALGTVAAENPFGRDRNVSVLEREHPEYTPEPIQVGSLEVMPRIAAGLGYDDNLFASRTDRIDDAYVRIRPRISVVRPSQELRLSLGGELDLLRYLDQISENSTNYTLNVGALSTVSRSTSLNLQARHGRFSEERASPDSPTGVTRPNRFTLNEASATLTRTFNRLRLRGVLDFEQRDYRDGRTPVGDVVDQDFRDHHEVTATGISEYALSPSIGFFVAGSYNRRDYRERDGLVPARDSEGYELALGSSFEIGRLMRGSLRGGYLRQDYRAAQFEDVSGFLVRGELAYFLTPLVTLTGTIDRGVRETGVAGATGYLATNMTLRADYELLRNLILSAGAELEKRDFANVDRKDDRWTYRASAAYSVSRQVALRADVQRRTQSSWGATPGREFEENRFSVGISFSGL